MDKVVSLNKIPSKSIILRGFEDVDYFDSYMVNKSTELSVDKIATEIFRMSKVGVILMRIRDNIVKIFGLTVIKEAPNEQSYYPVGSKLINFEVLARNENEIVMGENDKHLIFKTSVLIDKEKSKIYLTTIVKFNNWGGKLYFIPVKPIHKFLIKSQFKKKIDMITQILIFTLFIRENIFSIKIKWDSYLII